MSSMIKQHTFLLILTTATLCVGAQNLSVFKADNGLWGFKDSAGIEVIAPKL